MGRDREYFIERINPGGDIVILGQFWELQQKGQKPPRRILCPKDEAEGTDGHRSRPRTEEEKFRFLTRLYDAKLIELKKEFEKKGINKSGSEMISVVMQKWIDHVAVFRSPVTAEIYAQSTNHYIEAVGDHPIEEYRHVNNLKVAERLKVSRNRKKGTYSPATQIRHLKALQIFFNWAYQKEYISRQIKLDKPQADNKDIEIYSLNDLAKLNEYIVNRIETENHSIRKRNLINHRRAFIMAINTVMRRGPIWALPLKHIDLKKRVIRIRHNPELNWKNKKNKEVDKPINSKLYDFLARDLEARDPAERYYLDNGKGQVCYRNPIEISRAFSRHFTELGITHAKPFHGIRSTMITELIANGVDLKTVKDLADHESIVTTEKYANVKRLNSKEAVKKLPVCFDF